MKSILSTDIYYIKEPQVSERHVHVQTVETYVLHNSTGPELIHLEHWNTGFAIK